MQYSISPTVEQETTIPVCRRPELVSAADEKRIQCWEEYERMIDRRPRFASDMDYWKELSRLLKIAQEADDAYHAAYRKYWGLE